jgi:hypothetical protein
LNPFARHATTIDTAAPCVRDGRGRVLQIGDEIIVPGAPALYYVNKIERVVDPGLPPNLMDVLLVGTMRVRVPRDMPAQEIIRVMSAEERKPGPAIDLTDKEN